MDPKTESGMSIDYAAECIFSSIMDQSYSDENIVSNNPIIWFAIYFRNIFPDLIFRFVKLK